MAIACPYCKHSINLKNVKPGRYGPKCPKCTRAFRLVVPDDPAKPPTVRALAAPAAPEATVAHVSAAVPPAPGPEATAAATGVRAAAPDPDVTGAFRPDAETAPEATAAFAAESDAAVDQTVAPERASRVAPKPAAKAIAAGEVRATLGGYQMLKLLGKGGMGAVYLARQKSLDRLVAVKVMLPKAAGNPTFVARFTREAYAAAQMVHHNIVQIYDIGSARDTHYFGMEFVKGASLMDLVRREGKLDPEQAVGYVLQAARGLKYGHDMGMVHRDVKPDNIMLNDQGIVKVADMGLVKLSGDAREPGAALTGDKALAAEQSAADGLTREGFVMGTPSYMSPEQAANSSEVGPAADVYSLGCTLYVLLTGKPPFEGKTVMEVLTKHAKAPVVRPEAVVKRVPKALSDILVKMLAKKPEDRYADMGEVIEALENYLGVARAGPFTPREEHADALEKSVSQFNEAPSLKLRTLTVLGFYGGVALFVLALALFGWTTLAGGFLGLALLTPVFYFFIRGFARKTPLFLKVREAALAGGPQDWIVWGVSALLVLVLLWLFGLLPMWAAFSVLAVGAALGLYFGLDRRIAAERAPAIAGAEGLFKTMRLHGLEEAALRQFACKYSGSRWEEWFEALFGYEAKLQAREWDRGEMGKAREKFAAWREPVIAWIDARQQARKEARERRHLQAVEAKALQAQGVSAAEAKVKAGQVADAMVDQAAVIKAAAARTAVKPPAPAEATSAELEATAAEAPAPVNLKKMLETARKPEKLFTLKPKRKPGPGAVAMLLGEVFGPRLRFLAGAVLLTGFLLWLYQNDLLAVTKLMKQLQALLPFSTAKPQALAPLWMPWVPLEVTQLFGTVAAGAAGLILAISGVFSSRRMTFAVVPGAAAMFTAPWVAGWFNLPSLGPLDPSLAFFVGGLALALLGLLFLRKVRYRGPRAYDDEE